jgi:hypothetical protein
MEFTEKVQKLHDFIKQLSEENEALRREIAGLKGISPKPIIEPAKPVGGSSDSEGDKKKRGGSKPGVRRNKTKDLVIHKTEVIQPVGLVPDGSVFKGFQEFVVQDIVLTAYNTQYRLARWDTPDGQSLMGQLPEAVVGHFGSQLRSFILYQHNQCRVTEPLLLEQLEEFGIDISSGQLHTILTKGHEDFHQEKLEILEAGLQVSPFIQVDDTGARNAGKNGYCTVICNPYFAFYETTFSKSRINFLEILRAGRLDYIITEESVEYAQAAKLSAVSMAFLKTGDRFENKETWDLFLKNNGITHELHVRIATEAALIGSLMEHGFNPDLAIVSDDAGQFNVFLHQLCWIHAERLIKKLTPYTDEQTAAVTETRSQIWEFYDALTAYKIAPSPEKAGELRKGFDLIFDKKTCFTSLNLALKRLYNNKTELLVVLDRPEVPIHNNQSESDIREKVTRRKISVTFSEIGKKGRDTFSTLKKTCRKNAVSFWKYLNDRVSGQNEIARLGEIVRARVLASLEPQPLAALR